MRGEISSGRFCPKCEETERLEDTGKTFSKGYTGFTVYRCPSCERTFQVNTVYQVIEKEQKSGENQ